MDIKLEGIQFFNRFRESKIVKCKDMITIEDVKAIFENIDSDWEGDNAFQGLLIISKYFDVNKTEIITYASHDQIWSVDVDESIVNGMAKEDFEKLAKLNWMIEEETLSCFV